MAISVALVVPVTSAAELAGPGGVLTAIGRVSAMSGTYLLLVTLLLIARIPAVERAIGQDRLVKLHRTLGPAILGLIGVHVVSVVLGYAAGVAAGPWHELIVLATTFPGMLLAVAGFGLLLLAGFTSYRYVRRKLKYETWWAVHLYTYLAVALSIPHQILTGVPFTGHPLAMAWWLTLWFATAGAVLAYRWGLPIARSLTHRVTVHSVEEEAPGVVSVDHDRPEPAQARGVGRAVPPLALHEARHVVAGAPVLAVGGADHQPDADHRQGPRRSQQLPGERRAGDARGHRRPVRRLHTPRAAHRPGACSSRPASGVTPVRALLEDLPRHVDVVAILRGRSRRDLVLRDELAHLVGERGGQLHELLGPRSHARLDADGLAQLVPDIADRDLYICGPTGFTHGVIAAARGLGVSGERIHHEDFAF